MFDDDAAAGSFFDDADYEGVELQDFDFNLGEGRHNVTISKAGPITTKNGPAVIIEFTADGGKSYTQFLNAINPGDATDMRGERSLRDIKIQERVRVLEAVGVPRAAIKTLNPEKLVGTEGWLTISKNKAGYMNFRKFELTSSTFVPEAQKPVQVSAVAAAPSGGPDFGF